MWSMTKATTSFIPTATANSARIGTTTKWQGDFPDLAASVGATESIARALTDQGGPSMASRWRRRASLAANGLR